MKRVCINGLSLTAMLAAIVYLLLAAPRAHAQPWTLQIDENGNGLLNGVNHPGFIQPDSGPGGLPNALTYTLPVPNLVVGDLWIQEPGGEESDVVRWNPDGTLVFYSDLPDTGNPDLADIGLPLQFYANSFSVVETGLYGQPYSENGPNGFVYIPAAGQPGFDPSDPANQPTYIIISDIPEPSSVILIAWGCLALLWRRRN